VACALLYFRTYQRSVASWPRCFLRPLSFPPLNWEHQAYQTTIYSPLSILSAAYLMALLYVRVGWMTRSAPLLLVLYQLIFCALASLAVLYKMNTIHVVIDKIVRLQNNCMTISVSVSPSPLNWELRACQLLFLLAPSHKELCVSSWFVFSAAKLMALLIVWR